MPDGNRRKPINRAAAMGMSYSPGERIYEGELPKLHVQGEYVLTVEDQKKIHARLRAEKEHRRLKNQAKKERRKKQREMEAMVAAKKASKSS